MRSGSSIEGCNLAWLMASSLLEESQDFKEMKILLFILEHDDKRSFCEFYIFARSLIIEYLEGIRSCNFLLDQISMKISIQINYSADNVSLLILLVDQWSEVCRRLFPGLDSGTDNDEVLFRISKVITAD